MRLTELPRYYNRFSRSGSYRRNLFIAARGLQSAELNETFDYVHDNLRIFAESILGGDGLVLKGGKCILDANRTLASCSDASFLAEGYSLLFPSRDFHISNSGEYIIGVAIKQTVVTHLQDPSLRDPAPDTLMYGQPGAERLSVEGRWADKREIDDQTLAFSIDPTVEVERFYPIHRIYNGELVTRQPDEVGYKDSHYLGLLARYDRSAHGNYIVDGMSIKYVSEIPSSHCHFMNIEKGYAHVWGLEVFFENDRNFKLAWAEDIRRVNNEPGTFTTNGYYKLRHFPIARTFEVFGPKREIENVTHGSFTGCVDVLTKQPVLLIESITQGETEYIQGTSWSQSGDGVDWSLGGAEPSPGSTYVCKYQWNSEISESVTLSDDRTAIRVDGLVSGSVFFVDYDYFLPRWDRVVILKTSEIKIIKGVPADVGKTVKPSVKEGLQIASIYVSYGAIPRVYFDGFRAFEMSDIQKIQDKLYELQDNLARLAQLEDIKQSDPTTNKKNMFVEPFTSNNSRDWGLPNDSIVMDGKLVPNCTWKSYQIRQGQNVLLPFTEKTIIMQDHWTKARKVNEFDRVNPSIKISVVPKSFRWVAGSIGADGLATSVITDSDAEVPSGTWVTMSGGKFPSLDHISIICDDVFCIEAVADAEGMFEIDFEIPAGIKMGSKLFRAFSTQVGNSLAETPWIATAVRLKTAMITEARINDIADRVSKQNITTYDTIQSVERAKVKQRLGDLENSTSQMKEDIAANKIAAANANQLAAKAYSEAITAGKTATQAAAAAAAARVSVNITNQVSTQSRRDVASSFTPRVNVTNRTVVNSPWGNPPKVTVYRTPHGTSMRTLSLPPTPRDPLAQTFVMPEKGFITAMGIFVSKNVVDLAKDGLEVSLMPAKLGIPDRASVSNQVFKTGSNLVEKDWNWFNVDDPQFSESDQEMAMMVFSTDTTCEVRVAEAGAWDFQYNEFMTSQASAGVLLQSANQVSWNPIPKEDLTFGVKVAEFQGTQTLRLGTHVVPVESKITDINLTCTADYFSDTSLDFWIILKSAQNEKHVISPGKSVKVKLYSGEIELWVKMSTTNSLVSPVVSGDVTLSLGITKFPCEYTSRAFAVDGDEMRVNIDMLEPPGASVKVYAEVDENSTGLPVWDELTRSLDNEPIGDGWINQRFILTAMPSELISSRVRIVLNTTDKTLYARPNVENLRVCIV